MGGLPWDLALAAISLGVRIQALISAAESLSPTPSRGFLALPWPATAWHMVHLGEVAARTLFPFSTSVPSCAKTANGMISGMTTRAATAPCDFTAAFPPLVLSPAGLL